MDSKQVLSSKTFDPLALEKSIIELPSQVNSEKRKRNLGVI